MASYIGDLCGQTFTPAAKFIDLTLNGEYLGTYQISDQIEVNKKRVEVEEQDYPLTDESNITGGYLIEADGFKDFVNGVNGWYTPAGVPMTIHYPDDDEIAPEQLNYISKFVNDFETLILSDNYVDSDKGYRNLVDSTSLISWYLASEIAGNPDYVWSLYYYKHRNDNHLYFGPLWDFDIAFNNDRRLEDVDPTHNLMADVGFDNFGMGKWIKRMWTDKWFKQLVYKNYTLLYNLGLESKLLNKIDSLSQLLQESQELNYQKWGIDVRTWREIVLYSTYDEYVKDLRSYVSDRLPTLLTIMKNRLSEDSGAHEIVNFSVSDAGWATFSCDKDVSLSPAVAYAAKYNGSYVELTPATELPAGQAVVIEANGVFDYQFEVIQGASSPTNNDLKVSDGTITGTSGNIYVLANKEAGVGFYRLGGVTVPAGKAYLEISSSSSPEFLSINESGQTRIRTNDNNTEYVLSYNRQNQYLHFGSSNLDLLTFMVMVYDSKGRLCLSFPANKRCDVSMLPTGMYIVTWQYQGAHSVKLIKD